MGVPEPFIASLINKEWIDDNFAAIGQQTGNKYTPLEKAAILSVEKASEEVAIDLSSPRVLFLFSSTKGNIYLLDENENGFDNKHLYLWYSAHLIASYFKNPNTPVVVSNACISGAAAQIAAQRELASKHYDYAVVIGAEMLSKFILSGFQSFKALAPEICRPFDVERAGLNLGEAVATLIYKRADDEAIACGVSLQEGVIRNDANHISGPSRTGEGSYRALRYLLQETDPDEIAFINAHGTATPYNDTMEAIAITRAGLENVPVNSLKSYFGHTLGAAGILESIISMYALSDNIVLPVYGFSQGTADYPLVIAAQLLPAEKTYCLKMLSGFGGCNAALLFKNHQNENRCNPCL
jgi:3-oxoacyl-[acyl-carrier-protein] synthase-1